VVDRRKGSNTSDENEESNCSSRHLVRTGGWKTEFELGPTKVERENEARHLSLGGASGRSRKFIKGTLRGKVTRRETRGDRAGDLV